MSIESSQAGTAAESFGCGALFALSVETEDLSAGKGGARDNAKLTLVPFEAAEFHEGEIASQNYVSLKNIDKDRLTQAPTFTAQQLTSQQQNQWMAEVDQFFDRQKSGAARPDLDDKDDKDDKNPNRKK